MNTRSLPLLGAAALGCAAALLFGAGMPRPASAQLNTSISVPTLPQLNGTMTTASTTPQPIEVQPLDDKHFVMATREPRLVQQIGREGTAQNMLVTVVTYYEVRGERLLPLEHVRVPAGFRLVQFEQ